MSANVSNPANIHRTPARVDEFQLRQLALQHAITTHCGTVDEGQIVKAAEVYLTFLTGGAPQ
jgi:hypothetical protein